MICTEQPCKHATLFEEQSCQQLEEQYNNHVSRKVELHAQGEAELPLWHGGAAAPPTQAGGS